MKGEAEESGRVVCGGWAKEANYAVTEDITVARKNCRKFLQWPLFKDNNNDCEDDFFTVEHYSNVIFMTISQG